MEFPESASETRPSSARRLLAGAPWPAAGSVDAHVRFEQVRAIFEHALVAQVLSLSLAVLLVYVLRGVAEPGRLRTWLWVMAGVTTLRTSVALAYHRRKPAPEAMLLWERLFVFTLGTTSLAWGAGGLFIMPADSLAHQAVVYFFLTGVAGGALASYGAHPAACLLAITCLLVPSTTWFAFQDSLELRAMAAAGTVYVGLGFRALRTSRFFLRRTFQLAWELQQAYDSARELAHTDALTGLNNRRAFIDLAGKALAQAQRYARPVSVIMFDIDHFKRVNDAHGHAAGDMVLRAVADAIRRTVRTVDIVARLGGEEFVVLLPETPGWEAATLADRLRRDIEATRVTFESLVISFSCSFGVASPEGDADTLDPVLNRADRALYRAKTQGRNRVSVDDMIKAPES